MLAARAAVRHGVVAVTEATELGLTRGQLRAAINRGDWKSPMRGVLVASGAPATWHQLCAIATVAAAGVLSHRAAARLHRLDGFRDAAVELTVPLTRHWHGSGVIVHRSAHLTPSDIVTVAGIRVTSIARTLVDLGAVVDGDAVEQALDDALRRGNSLRWVVQTLDRLRRPGNTGAGVLSAVLERPDRRGPLPDSRFERLLERVCVGVGLPQPDRQIGVRDADGRLIASIDAGWPDRSLGIEGHSARWHGGAQRGRSDQARDNRLAAVGWELLYAGWADAQEPDEFTALVRAAYDLRSP